MGSALSGRGVAPAAACVAAVASWLGGCATFDDHMRAGRFAQACEAAREDKASAAKFAAWLDANVRVTATLVPQEEVEALLGGPLAAYGVDVGVYDVTGTVPAGTVPVPDLPGEVAATTLVGLLPPLALEAEPLVPPGPVKPDEMAVQALPAPESDEAPRRSGGFFGDFVGALAGAAFDVGRVVGGVIMFPAALSVGMVVGTVEVVSNLAGSPVLGTGVGQGLLGRLAAPSGRTTTSTSPPRPAHVVPVYVLRPTKVSGTLDALLDEREHAALSAARLAAWEARRAEVVAEHARRVTLADEVKSLVGACVAGRCRRVHRPRTVTTRVWPFLEQGGTLCAAPGLSVPVRLPDGAATARPPWPTPVAPATVLVEDADAPAWATSTPTSTTLPWSPVTASLRVASLLCQVRVAKAAFVGRTPPTLGVRVTVGKELPRVQRWHLGRTPKSVAFLAPGVNLVAGERLRLTLVDEENRRGLGGGIVEMTGELPLVLKSPAWETRCTEASAEALGQAAGDLESRTLREVEGLDAALRDNDAAAVATRRRAARDGLTALAMHAGWTSARVVAARAALAAADPAERLSPSSR